MTKKEFDIVEGPLLAGKPNKSQKVGQNHKGMTP